MFKGFGASDQFTGPLKPLQYFGLIVSAQVNSPSFYILEELFNSVCLGPSIDYFE
jgi:hypothetical protein